MSHDAPHLPRKPLINKIVVCRLLAFLLLFSSAAAVYFVIKTVPHGKDRSQPKPVTPKYYAKLEGVQPEERDVFQDFRTSFLPPEEIVIPDSEAQRSKRGILWSNLTVPVWQREVESEKFGGRVKRTDRSSNEERRDETNQLEEGRWSEDPGGDESQAEDESSEDGYYDDYEEDEEMASGISKESLGQATSHGVDRGPLDDVVEQVRGQPELEEGELGDASHLYKPNRRYTGQFISKESLGQATSHGVDRGPLDHVVEQVRGQPELEEGELGDASHLYKPNRRYTGQFISKESLGQATSHGVDRGPLDHVVEQVRGQPELEEDELGDASHLYKPNRRYTGQFISKESLGQATSHGVDRGPLDHVVEQVRGQPELEEGELGDASHLYKPNRRYTGQFISKESLGQAISHGVDRGPLDDVVEQVRGQPELEEGELGDASHLYKPNRRYTGQFISKESLGQATSHGVDRGPLDHVVEQVRGQPELEEDELGDASHLYKPNRRYTGQFISKESLGQATSHGVDRGPLDDVVEQVRGQPELEEGELGDASHLYKPNRRYTGQFISKESLGQATSHGVDRGPLDDVVEQVRGQPELEEGELGDASHLYKPNRRYTGIHAFWKGQGDKETIRQTQASIMRQYMDADADPCQDFFQYACGNWPALNPIPADKAGYDTFEMLRENLDTVLKDLLEFKKGEYYPSKYPGPHLDLYDNFLSNKYNTIDKPVIIKENPRIIVENDIEHDKYSDRDKITERNLIVLTTMIFVENTTVSQSLKGAETNLKTNSELLHRIRRYINQKKQKFSKHGLKSKFQAKKIRENLQKEMNKHKIIKRNIIKAQRQNEDTLKKYDIKLGRRLQYYKRKVKRNVAIDSDEIEKRASEKDQDPAGGDAALKARFLFKSCMNYEILQKRGHQPLLDLLELLGGWPILKSNWNSSNFDWLESMANLRLYNNDILISEWVGPDIKNSDEFVIQFDQTSLGLPTRDYFLQDSNKLYLQAYKEYLIKIALLLGGDRDQVLESADELIQFETRLAKITSAPEDRRNVSELYRRMSVRRLEALLPGVRWRHYLCIVMNRTVDPEETVVLFALKYVRNLVRLVNQTEPTTLANYLLWRFVRHRVNNLDDRFQAAKQQFYNILFGREKAPPRWKNCISQVNSNMGMALGSMFVRKYFDETSKNDTLTMTREIQQSFMELLHLTDWIDDDTKILAAHKVDAMMLRIGYPDFILRKKELDERYQEVKIHPDKYFENILNILQHLTKMEQSRLGQPVNKTLWNTAPAVVNAYYSRNKNQIMFPAGILQPPFYHRHFPRSLNYGGIGVVIGHEITHGFDDKGRLFDCDGNLHRWWSDSAIESFHRRAQCLIDQYGRYVVPEVNMKLDGVNTQGENIADNGGVKQAFRAYRRWLAQNDAGAETLPGLNHTHTQLFFLNFAQVWCGAMRPEAMRNKLKTAVHSPGRFRVIGALSNSEDFAREFSCAPGTPMNPPNKCSVW